MTVDVAKEGLCGCRVLIVEDRYLVADDLSRMLTRNGAEIVAVAGDVGRASELAATRELDLSVLDVDLRGQDVFVVELKMLKSGPKPPKGVRIVS